MKFTKHLPFILKAVAITTFFLAAFIFYDSFKVANEFKNYVVLEKDSMDETEFSEIAPLFNGEVMKDEISQYKKYTNDEIIVQTEHDSIANYFLSIPLKGKKTSTSIKRIRESVNGIYVNPFELKTGYSYYFLYADSKNDESEKIIFSHDGEVRSIGEYFSFKSSFVKVYSDHQLILHFDFDEQCHFSLKKYEDAEHLNLVISLPAYSSPAHRNKENKRLDHDDVELQRVELNNVEVSPTKRNK